ncbi:MAG: cupin domain-containing protein [Oscillospiraceae bacterium]|nr:cupin domain-containing protein [Oscillospiraceae bacterium]
MADMNREIGERIRGVRELSDWSVTSLAEAAGISPEELTAYEQGKRDIPVSVLHGISVALGIGVTELMTGEDAKLTKFCLVRRDRGVSVSRRAAYDYRSLAYNFAGRRMDPYLITIAPGAAEAPYALTTHSGQEFHLCLEGSFTIQIGGHEVALEPGDSIYFDSATPHGMKAREGKPAQALVVVAD